MSSEEILKDQSLESKTKKSSSCDALVPYRANVPALLPPSLGDIDAYIRAANSAPVLSAEEEHSLAVKLRDENDLSAAQKLILSHLRLVVSVARGYLGYGLPHADLIQEGNIGLMKAVKHYDPDKGVRLMSFAVHWIRAEIQDYVVRNWRLVKVATTKNQRKLFFNLRQMKPDDKSLTTSQADEIAKTLDVKPEEVFEMEQRMGGADLSMEGSDSEDDDSSYAPADYLASDEPTPLEEVEQKDAESHTKAKLKEALASLDARSRRVIEARWLAEDDNGNTTPMTLQELAEELGVSSERVRQIEKKALAKMRESMLSGASSGTNKEAIDV
jgi:RNA polymerase sigma-32 factor